MTQREIKFRAWDEEKKEIYKVATLLLPVFESKNLMQFTGLKDKNGKEIYEGDIVTWGFGNAAVEMKTDIEDGDKEKTGWWADDSFVDLFCEVIGNIHENPELIK